MESLGEMEINSISRAKAASTHRATTRSLTKHPPSFSVLKPFLWEMALMESRVLERMVESRESKDHKGPIGFLFNIYFYCMCVFLHVHVFHLCARGCGGQKRESDP